MRALITVTLIFVSLSAGAQISPAEKFRLQLPIRAMGIQLFILDSYLNYTSAKKFDDIQSTTEVSMIALDHLTPLPAYDELQSAVIRLTTAVLERLRYETGNESADTELLREALSYLRVNGNRTNADAFQKNVEFYSLFPHRERALFDKMKSVLKIMQVRESRHGSYQKDLAGVSDLRREVLEREANQLSYDLSRVARTQACPLLLMMPPVAMN